MGIGGLFGELLIDGGGFVELGVLLVESCERRFVIGCECADLHRDGGDGIRTTELLVNGGEMGVGVDAARGEIPSGKAAGAAVDSHDEATHDRFRRWRGRDRLCRGGLLQIAHGFEQITVLQPRISQHG